MAKMAIPTIPPTTPPTIGPTGVELAAVVGRVDDVGVGEGALRVVPTPEPEPPSMGEIRK